MDSRPDVEGIDMDDNGLDMDDLDSAFEDDSDGAGSVGDIKLDDVETRTTDNDSDGMDFDDDPEALLDSEDEIPSDLDKAFEKEIQFAADPAPSDGNKRSKRRRLKNLPTFASAEDYAAMLDTDDNEV